MATINSIRKRSGLVIGFIGISILLFVVSDAFQSGGSLFQGKVEEVVGEIDGEEISRAAYDEHFQRYARDYQGSNNVNSLPTEKRMQVNNNAWSRLIVERMVGKEMDELGIKVGADELWYQMQGKDQPHQIIAQSFTNPETKEFDKARLVGFVENIDKADAQARDQWRTIEEYIETSRQENKFLNLIEKASYVTELEAKYKYLAEKKSASIKYIALKAADDIDTTIDVSDAEIKAYAESHKELYKQQDGRSIKFAKFAFEPSSADTAALMKEMNNLKAEFVKAADGFRFARLHTETALDSTYKKPGDLPSSKSAEIMALEKGGVVGPYREYSTIKMHKLLDAKTAKKPFIKASEILVEIKRTTKEDSTESLKKGKELFAKIKAGEEEWETAARKNNKGQKAINGGDMGWFEQGSLSEEITTAFEGKDSGDIFMIQDKAGTHIYRIDDKPVTKTYSIVTIEKEIVASETTRELAYNKAKEFQYAATSAQAFMDEIANRSIDLNSADFTKDAVAIPGVPGDARQIRQWAFNQKKVDAITDEILELDDAYVVALLTEIKVEGELDIDGNKLTIRDEVIKQKKIDKLYNKLKDAYNSDINAMASSVGATVQSAVDVNMSRPLVPELGNEPTVLGTIFALNSGETSKVIKGDAGAFVVYVESFTDVALPDNFVSYRKEQNLIENVQTRAKSQVFTGLTDLAKPVDNRYLYY
ncbi:MAG: SurA N-terminal domain-containing protein [Bacteroidetes bacterium]|nr:SurA N-terminal domain-containing protein [Bacteroidota bacterium]